MSKHFVIIAYDIPDNKRRTKLHDRLEDYGTPVQYSVFECLVDDEELAKMRSMVKRMIKPRLDHVRFYFLCQRCQGHIETTTAGSKIAVKEEAVLVI